MPATTGFASSFGTVRGEDESLSGSEEMEIEEEELPPLETQPQAPLEEDQEQRRRQSAGRRQQGAGRGGRKCARRAEGRRQSSSSDRLDQARSNMLRHKEHELASSQDP